MAEQAALDVPGFCLDIADIGLPSLGLSLDETIPVNLSHSLELRGHIYNVTVYLSKLPLTIDTL